MKVLEDHSAIRELVAARFDELIVDEAQDTSAIQLRCLSVLKTTGRLDSLVLIGDPDQAIYEWQGSDPVACRTFADEHDLGTLELTRNFRSSQAICNVIHRLSSRAAPEDAAGHERDFGVAPEILIYDEPRRAVDAFRARLESLDIAVDPAPVLVRSRSHARKLNSISNVKASWQVRALGDAAATFATRYSFEVRNLKAVEDALHRLAWGTIGRLDSAHRAQLRDTACRLITALPSPAGDKSLKEWIGEARGWVTAAVAELSDDPMAKVGSVIRARASDDDRLAGDVFPTTVTVSIARTVHSAKGETHEAVLLLSGKATAKGDSARDWIKGELGEDTDEETRIGYVGLSRARKYCAVALPDTTPADVIAAYEAAGFVKVTATVKGTDRVPFV